MAGDNPQLSVASQPTGPKPSSYQKRFNSLLKKIQTHRGTLEAWNSAELAYQKLWAEEFIPTLDKLQGYQLELLLILDAASMRMKFSKKDLGTLQRLVHELIDELMAGGHPQQAELKEIFSRHAGVDFDTFREEETAQFKAILERELDVELDDDSATTPEELAQILFAKLSNDAGEAPKQSANRKKTAREIRQEQELAKGSQSVREIYRKLASALHPDRETDEAERTRKTALMQRVNHAYAAKDLLSLLELQLEIEQIDSDHISTLPQERIKHYNRVLAEQVKELEEEISFRNFIFNEQFELPPFETTKPAGIPRKCDRKLGELVEELFDLEYVVEDLKPDAKNIKFFLRSQRETFDEWDNQSLLDDLFR
ncbi:molecular chaperone DnaJ [Pseudomonas sp. G.S.17]|uniref:molecular chaperone DnaJ n=1 Tax=Pseudomonas sp. G.S.17 TaxID=3137451 RepID=UPI00311CB6F2